MRQVRILLPEPITGRSSVVERLVEAQREGGSIPSVPAINCRNGEPEIVMARSAKPNKGRCKSGPFLQNADLVFEEGPQSATLKKRVRLPQSAPTFAGLVFVARAFGFQPNEASSTLAVRTNTGVKCYGSTTASKSVGQGSIPCTSANPRFGHGLSSRAFNTEKRVRVS